MTSPRTATAATLLSLTLAGLMNVEAMARRIELEPETKVRAGVLAALGPVRLAGEASGLTVPRRWLRGWVHGPPVGALEDVAGGDGTEASGPSAVPSPDGAEAHVLEEDGRGGTALAHEPAVAERAGPPVVWVFGDSLINMGGPRLATLLEEAMGADVWVDSRPNTGLVRVDYYSWPAALANRLGTEPPPDLAIVLMGANDGQNMRIDGVRTERWSEPWAQEYGLRAGAVMDLLVDSGARVAWLGLPGMRSRSHQRTADLLNRVLVQQAAVREAVRVVPTEGRFAYRGKRFSTHLERADGQRFSARAGDGVHFTWSGSQVLADHVVEAVQATWPELWTLGPAPLADGSTTALGPASDAQATADAGFELVDNRR